MATPLLDWTRSPFVAAYFAFRDFAFRQHAGLAAGYWGLDNTSGRVYFGNDRVAVWGMDVREVFVADEFELLNPLPYANARQRAQQGLFTRLRHAALRDVESYLSTSGHAAERLTRWTIPGTETERALFALRQMNITIGTLFPDLPGAAEETNLAHMWSTYGSGPGANPPFIAYGSGVNPGDIVEALVNGVTSARTLADTDGNWILWIDQAARGRPNHGSPISFRLNGTDVAATETWRSGGAPTDAPNGVTLLEAPSAS